jgi:hypothetical protein
MPANTNPPTTTIPKEVLLPEEVPSDNAMGKVPKIMARVVIRMGRNLEVAAANTASRTLMPSALRWLANSTIKIPFLVIYPISMIIPISLNTLMVWPVSLRLSIAPVTAIGTVSRMMKGSIKLSNCAASTR